MEESIGQTGDNNIIDLENKSYNDLEEALARIRLSFPVSDDRLKTYSPLSFAYMGDVVYELVIRTMIVARGNTRSNRYHHKTIGYVNASAQTSLMRAIEPLLTEEELRIYHRGLNAKPATTAKNQTRHDYRIATGFETLIGYLYLSGQTDRLLKLISMGMDKKEDI